MVRKKSGDFRFCVDFRKINEVIEDNNYPLPIINDSLTTLGLQKACFFSKLDVSQAFHQAALHEDSYDYTGFVTHSGLWRFKRVPMGLKTSSAAFQAIIQCILRGLINTIAMAYLDDCLIFSPTFTEHTKDISTVLQRFRDHNVKLSSAKCQFAVKSIKSIKFLGHKISQEGLKPDDSKIEIIKKYPVPNNVPKLRSALGLFGYYRRFVPNYAKEAAPLSKLLCKNTPFNWTEDCQKAFDYLRNSLINYPILAYPEFNVPNSFILYTDASKQGIGGVLAQTINGTERTIAYFAKSLNKAESNYSVTNMELLAVVRSVQHFDLYLRNEKFLVITDHHSLKFLTNMQNPSSRLARWLEILSNYDFKIKHRPGRIHNNADSLSRLPFEDIVEDSLDLNALTRSAVKQAPKQTPNKAPPRDIPNTAIDNDDIIVQTNKDKPPIQITPHNAELNMRDVSIAQQNDPNYKHIYEYLLNGELPNESKLIKTTLARAHDYTLIDSVLYHIREQSHKQCPDANRTIIQLAVPSSHINIVLHNNHSDVFAGHLGQAKSYERLRLKYYWPNQYVQRHT